MTIEIASAGLAASSRFAVAVTGGLRALRRGCHRARLHHEQLAAVVERPLDVLPRPEVLLHPAADVHERGELLSVETGSVAPLVGDLPPHCAVPARSRHVLD